jgi:hypothetical protein
MGTASLIKDISGVCTSVTDSKYCIDKAILRSRSNNVDHMSEDIPNNLHEKIKITR